MPTTPSADESAKPENRFVLPETRALAILGCFDLLTSIYLIATRKAHEANPLMSNILANFGPAGFAVFKAMLLAVPLMIAETARKHSPVFVPRALRVGLITYVVLLLFAYRNLLTALFATFH